MLLKVAVEALNTLAKPLPAIPLAPDAGQTDDARQILQDTESCATSVYRAACKLVGKQLLNWEPESIWFELKDHEVDLSDVNRDKLLAVSTLLQYPAFYWDAGIFENTTMAFNNYNVMPEVLQEATPAQLSWAVYEAELLMRSDGQDPEFDYEPARYAAVVMHRQGLLLAPSLLVFAQEELDKLNRGHKDLAEEVKKRWEALDKNKLDTVEFKEDSIDVQLSQLATIELYVNERAKRYSEELKRL
jgi:hypothetical protein